MERHEHIVSSYEEELSFLVMPVSPSASAGNLSAAPYSTSDYPMAAQGFSVMTKDSLPS
jgi:hypothetical protein